jgi:FtsP/CotA-like multicopper oxidase with cupredoxin domain
LLIVVVATLQWTMPARTQALPPEDCLKPGEPLLRMPELISQNGKLRATILLTDELRRLNDTQSSPTKCAEIYLRHFDGVNAVPPATPPGPDAPVPPSRYTDPVPGPTLRARVGDIIQLTFLNHVDPLRHARTLDRGADAGACDQFSPPGTGYPANANDTFPNCFHGSSTANLHFHGTHTNPNSAGDNVFLQVRPSPRDNDKPIVDAESVRLPFDNFFSECEYYLKQDILSGWPHRWDDLPSLWRQQQKALLQAHDEGRAEAQKLWPENERQIKAGRWPQYYVGAFPFCFLLPDYSAPAATSAPTPHHTTTPAAMAKAGPRMGQAPGIHWYHAHKHGSTALNVANGMTGAFIIEGKYDDDLNAFYGQVGGKPWTRAQPVLVINQLGGTPNLAANPGGGAQAFSVNGRLQPRLAMRPGEVQLWRIVNTSSRSFVNFLPPPSGFEWRQIAQDGVQFARANYKDRHNKSFPIAPGNRVDLLVKAPTNLVPDTYNVMVQDFVTRTGLTPTNPAPVPLMSVKILGSSPENPRQTQFIGLEEDPTPTTFPRFPEFLADISDKEIKTKRVLTFNSKGFGAPHQHTIDDEQFSEKIGVSILLNTVEEWTIQNTTTVDTGNGPPITNIDHPFHIHVNPFQVVEVFDPNSVLMDADGNPLTDGNGNPFPRYVFDLDAKKRDEQCLLDPLGNPENWKPCDDGSAKVKDLVWWDVFPIPSGKVATKANGGQIKGANNEPIVIPGYFKMRSRFVDYPGTYVLHCHILAHEDRGMMTIVEVRPRAAPASHH